MTGLAGLSGCFTGLFGFVLGGCLRSRAAGDADGCLLVYYSVVLSGECCGHREFGLTQVPVRRERTEGSLG